MRAVCELHGVRVPRLPRRASRRQRESPCAADRRPAPRLHVPVRRPVPLPPARPRQTRLQDGHVPADARRRRISPQAWPAGPGVPTRVRWRCHRRKRLPSATRASRLSGDWNIRARLSVVSLPSRPDSDPVPRKFSTSSPTDHCGLSAASSACVAAACRANCAECRRGFCCNTRAAASGSVRAGTACGAPWAYVGDVASSSHRVNVRNNVFSGSMS